LVAFAITLLSSTAGCMHPGTGAAADGVPRVLARADAWGGMEEAERADAVLRVVKWMRSASECERLRHLPRVLSVYHETDHKDWILGELEERCWVSEEMSPQIVAAVAKTIGTTDERERNIICNALRAHRRWARPILLDCCEMLLRAKDTETQAYLLRLASTVAPDSPVVSLCIKELGTSPGLESTVVSAIGRLPRHMRHAHVDALVHAASARPDGDAYYPNADYYYKSDGVGAVELLGELDLSADVQLELIRRAVLIWRAEAKKNVLYDILGLAIGKQKRTSQEVVDAAFKAFEEVKAEVEGWDRQWTELLRKIAALAEESSSPERK